MLQKFDLCVIIYTAKENILPCSVYYSSFDPTHFSREFSSVCGLQTSRPAEEGSEKHKGVYPPASCGFYALYDGKADFFTQKSFLINKYPESDGISLSGLFFTVLLRSHDLRQGSFGSQCSVDLSFRGI